MANTARGCGETDEQFLARMEAQCFQIDRYRWQVRLAEGRNLSADEAAREWIERYAAEFAREHNASIDS